MLGRHRYRYEVARAPGGFPSSWRTLFGGKSAGDAKVARAPGGFPSSWRPFFGGKSAGDAKASGLVLNLISNGGMPKPVVC